MYPRRSLNHYARNCSRTCPVIMTSLMHTLSLIGSLVYCRHLITSGRSVKTIVTRGRNKGKQPVMYSGNVLFVMCVSKYCCIIIIV